MIPLVLPTLLGPVSTSISQMGNQAQEVKRRVKGRRASPSRSWDLEPRPSPSTVALACAQQHPEKGPSFPPNQSCDPSQATSSFCCRLSRPFLRPFPGPPARTQRTAVRDSGVPRARSTFPSGISQALSEAAETSSPGTYMELNPEAEQRPLLGTVTEKNMGNQLRHGTLVCAPSPNRQSTESCGWPSSIPGRASASLIPPKRGGWGL